MSLRDLLPTLFVCLATAVVFATGSGMAIAQDQIPVEAADVAENVAEEASDVADEITEKVDEAVGEAEEVSQEEGFDDAVEETDEEIAAEEPEGGQDPADVITVTANRRQENIQDAALSVTALSSTFIEDVGLTDFTEMQKFTPNLLITQGIDSRSTAISIRGIGNSGGANAGIDPTVAVFIDGVYQGRAGMSVQDLLDIQGVEILRGPQGTLYGKNTAAGAIKVETKDPGYEPELSVEFVGGDYTDLEGRFSGNYPIVDDVLATRFSGYIVSREGFETNRSEEFDGDDVNGADKWGLRNKTLWDVDDDWHVLLSGDYSSQKQTGFVPEIKDYTCEASDGEFFPNACKSALPTAQDIDLDEPDFEDRDVYTNVKPTNDVTTGGVSLEVTHERWDHEFTSLTAFRNYTSESFWDADFTEIDATTWDIEADLQQVSTELRVGSPAWNLLDYVGGFYFYYSDMQTDDTLGQSEAYWAPVFGPNDGQRTTADNNHKTTSVAGYADASINLDGFWENLPDITLSSGVRVGWEKKELVGSHRSEGFLGMADTAISGPDIDFDDDETETYVTFREVLRYKPTENIMLYASYATGFKSGGYNQLRQSPDRDFYFDPEKSKSWEGGIKTTWFDRMVTFNITGFYTDYEDFQVVTSDGFSIKVINAKGFYSTGFETDLTIIPIAGWVTSLGVGYVKTKYDDYENGPCTAQGIRDEGLTCEQDLTGKRTSGTPRLNLTAFSAYQRALPWWDIDWFAQLNYNYMSKRFLGADLDRNLLADRAHLLDLRAGLRHPDMTWEVTAWVKNVLDDTFLGAGFDIPVLGGYAVVAGPPRTAGATVRLNF